MTGRATAVHDLDENFALKTEALGLAFKARGYANHLRESGGDGNADDYDELAAMISRLVRRVPS